MIQFTPSQTTDAWCLYTLTNEQGEVILVWHCKFANALAVQDALSNPNFNRNAPVIIHIVALYNSRVEASNAVGLWIRQHQVTPSLNRTMRTSHYAPIKCAQTGQVYRNASEASRVTGVNQSQLSQHLRGNPSNKTVRGLTFSYVDGNELYRSQFTNSTHTPQHTSPVGTYPPTQQFEQQECFTHRPNFGLSDWDDEN